LFTIVLIYIGSVSLFAYLGFLEQALHLQLLQKGNALFIALPHSALAFAVHRVAPQRCPNIFD
jgi:uncharacterized membrane protein YhfC